MKLLRFAVLFMSLTLSTSTSSLERDRLYIWNVGQGSWSTLISTHFCYHFDMGGEFWPNHKALTTCQTKKNVLFLSHLDSDHISFIKRSQRGFRELCLFKMPNLTVIKSLNKKWMVRQMKAELRRRQIVEQLPACDLSSRPAAEISKVRNIMFRTKDDGLKTSNEQSEIYIFAKRWLFTGDSTKKAEELWAPHLASTPIEFLVVGHHGSRTSTSDFLLQQLPHLKMAIVSARHRKYHHPHTEIVARLQKNKTPLLLTEKWGHLVFEL